MLKKRNLLILLFLLQNTIVLSAQNHKDSVSYMNLFKKYEQEKQGEEYALKALSDSLSNKYDLHLLQNEIEEKILKKDKLLMYVYSLFFVFMLFNIFLAINIKLRKKLKTEYKILKKMIEKTRVFYNEIDQKQKEIMEDMDKAYKEKYKEEFFVLSIQKIVLEAIENKKTIPPQEFFAEKMGMSAKQLRSILQNTAWENFNGLINKIRIEYVIEEIGKNPDINLTQLAKDLFISYNTLKVNFKKYLDISPSSFREIVREEKKLNKEEGKEN